MLAGVEGGCRGASVHVAIGAIDGEIGAGAGFDGKVRFIRAHVAREGVGRLGCGLRLGAVG